MLKQMTVRFAIIAFACTVSVAAHAMADTPKSINVPAGSLTDALKTLARQCGVDVIYPSDQIKGRKTQGLSGTFETRQAFEKLIAGTPLIVEEEEGGSVLITLPHSGAVLSEPDTPATSTNDEQSPDGALWSRLQLAQANQGTAGSSAAVSDTNQSAAPDSQKPPQLEEVVVTAEKRAERLQDVPVPVTVINADNLASNSQLLLRDYYSSIPGLNLTPLNQGTQMLSIRGITTGGITTNPTVGVLVDDVPFGASTSKGQGNLVPDIDPGDLARIEVLRGPQGTLYGADSMGGLIKYVTIDPSTDGYSGRLEAGTDSVQNGAEPGFNIRGSANIPLGDTVAVRISGFRRQDPGYIDDPGLNLRGVNQAEVYGGRMSALWRMSASFSLKLSALYQKTSGNGLSEVDKQPGLGDLQQSSIPGVGGYERAVQAYSATLKGDLGGIELVSVTGYNATRYHDSFGINYYYSSFTQRAFPGVTNTPFTDHAETNKVTEELRLSGSVFGKLDWLGGLFFTHEDVPNYYQTVEAENDAGQIVGQSWHLTHQFTFQEEALFTDLTYHFTDAFDIQAGARESHIEETLYPETDTGPFDLYFDGGPSPVVTPGAKSTGNAFTYLFTPRLKLSPDVMLYVRLASGYRPGGPNVVTRASGAPTQYNADKTMNYEIGLKGDFLDHLLSVDASLYYIDWQDLQIQRVTPALGAYETNGSGAKSEGVELSLTLRPVAGLTIGAWVNYDDAVLTKEIPRDSAYGLPGDRLPYSSRISGNFSVHEEFPVTNSLTGFIGGNISYTGDREGVFLGNPQRQNFPGYAKTDLNAGIHDDSWTWNAYVTNLANVRGVLDGGMGYLFPYAFIYIQPRTVGLSVSKKF